MPKVKLITAHFIKKHGQSTAQRLGKHVITNLLLNNELYIVGNEFRVSNVCKRNDNLSVERERAKPIVWWLAIVENGIQQKSKRNQREKLSLLLVIYEFIFSPANTEGLLWSRSKSFSCEPEEALINKFVCLPSDDIPHSQPSMSGSLEHCQQSRSTKGQCFSINIVAQRQIVLILAPSLLWQLHRRFNGAGVLLYLL